MIRVLLADDQPLVRTGFAMILGAEPDIEVVGEAGDGADAVRQCRKLGPDVAVMDIRMPVQDGIAATAQIAAEELARVLVLTTFHLDEYVIAALRDHLLTKLDVRDRVQLVIFAYDAGLAGSPS